MILKLGVDIVSGKKRWEILQPDMEISSPSTRLKVEVEGAFALVMKCAN